jgi:hypothetical protein
MPLHFVPNEGQVDGPAAFYVQGSDKTIYFAAEGLTFVLSRPLESTSARSDGMLNPTGPRARKTRMLGVEGSGGAGGGPAGFPSERWVVKLDFVGANAEAIPVSLEESGALISYFKGKPEDWKTGLPASSKIVYRGLWPGIDLLYYGTMDRMKYEFIVYPGADPSRIKLAYRGAESVTLTDEGRLAIATPVGGFEDDVPVAWQEVGGIRPDVAVAYVLDAEEAVPGGQRHVYGFEVGEYDESLPLVLDPAVLVYCGYIGGSGSEDGTGIAVDSPGNAYVTGITWSTEATFPVVVGPDLTINAGVYDCDAFVAKVNAEGTALVYCGYIGGSGFDYGYGIAVDGSGNAYVTGETKSWEDTFPVVVGPDLTYNGGWYDAFIVKVNADGTALVYCGYIGGWYMDGSHGIAVDGSGNAYITGYTESTEYEGFPVIVGPDLTYNNSHPGYDFDAFVAKVNADGTALVYCGYIGGSSSDFGHGIAADGSGNAYVAGETYSWDDTFPVVVGPDLTSYRNPTGDAFVTKVNASGTALVYCGYISGFENDYGYGIAVDRWGNAYVTGETESKETTFPVTVGPDLSYNDGFRDAFVAKVNADGTALVYCGYLGGSGWDRGYGIALDGSGQAYITGRTSSTEVDFPVVVGPGLTYQGWDDAFVAKVNAPGTALVYCGYIGGSDLDAGWGIAVDGSGYAYVTGSARSASTEATFPVVVGPDLTYNGGEYDVFAAKISLYDVSAPALASLLPSSAVTGDPALTMSVAGTDFADGAVVRWDGSDRPTVFLNEWALNAEIEAADLETVKIVAVTVRNADGGVSNAMEFTVYSPVPFLTSLSPTKTTAGGSGFTLTLLGSNFVTNSVVQWGGNTKATTFVSGTELQAAIAAADIATAGEFQVAVFNPTPGGGTSNAVAFPVAGFSMGASPTSATVTAGQSATYTVQVTPQYSSFDSAITFSATGLPRGCTASFSPATVTPGANPASSTLTLTTKARTEASTGGVFVATGHVPPALGLLILIPAIGLWFRFGRPVPVRLSGHWLAAGALICLIVLIGRCSAGDTPTPPPTGTPAGTYQITVRGESGSLKTSTMVTLIVR